MKGKWLLLVCGFFLLALLLVALFWLDQERILSRAPQRVSTDIPHKAMDSTISVTVEITAQRLQTELNQVIDEKYDIHTREEIAGTHFGIKGWIKREGDAQVVTIPNGLKISLGASFYIKARPSNDLVRAIIGKPTANGALRAELKIWPHIQAKWDPDFKTESQHQWIRNPMLDVRGAKFDVGFLADEPVAQLLRDMTEKMKAEARQQLQLRQKADQVWKDLHQPHAIHSKPLIWLNLQPQNIFVPSVYSSETAIHASLGFVLKASTHLGEQPTAVQPTPLPDLKLEPPPIKGFFLQLPIILPYQALIEQAGQHIHHDPLSFEHSGSRVDIDVEEIAIYPASEKLVVGAKINARAPTQLWRTRGWLYLAGTPVLLKDERTFQIEDLEFTRATNNTLVNFSSWLFQDEIRKRLQAAMVLDYSDYRQTAIDAANQALTRDLGNGLHSSGSLQDLQLEHLYLSERSIVATFTVKGSLTIALR